MYIRQELIEKLNCNELSDRYMDLMIMVIEIFLNDEIFQEHFYFEQLKIFLR